MRKIVNKKNKSYAAICIFMFFFILIQMVKPNLLYDKTNGALRQFGIGSKKKTIIPLWLVSIVLAILSYSFVLYFML